MPFETRMNSRLQLAWKVDLLEIIVASLMVMHVALGSECLRALLTDKRPFIFVNSLMNLQILLLGKSLMARRKRAPIWLGAEVDVYVCLQSNATVEYLPAAFVRAEELLDFFERFNLSFFLSWRGLGQLVLFLLVETRTFFYLLVGFFGATDASLCWSALGYSGDHEYFTRPMTAGLTRHALICSGMGLHGLLWFHHGYSVGLVRGWDHLW